MPNPDQQPLLKEIWSSIGAGEPGEPTSSRIKYEPTPDGHVLTAQYSEAGRLVIGFARETSEVVSAMHDGALLPLDRVHAQASKLAELHAAARELDVAAQEALETGFGLCALVGWSEEIFRGRNVDRASADIVGVLEGEQVGLRTYRSGDAGPQGQLVSDLITPVRGHNAVNLDNDQAVGIAHAAFDAFRPFYF